MSSAPTSNVALTVDLYLHVSRVAGRENLISPGEQERRARALTDSLGLTVGIVLTDLDESGGKWDRPGLQKALARVRDGHSGGIVVAWLDRLSRDSEHAHRILRELEESGGKVFAPDMPADWASPSGELQTTIMFGFAQYTRKRAAESLEHAKAQAIARGIPVLSFTPTGYLRGEDRRLAPHPKTAEAVTDAFERRARGESLLAVAATLEAAGVTTSRGSTTWRPQAVQCLIGSRVYLGEVSCGRDRRYVNTAAHEPLVDLPTWLAAQAPHGRQPRRAATASYMLAGVVRCAACGHALQGARPNGGKRVYRCRRRHAGGICPAPARVNADRVEQEIAKRIRDGLVVAFEGRGDQVVPIPGAPNLDALEADLELAERRLSAALAPAMADAAGDDWPTLVASCRKARDAAAEVLGHARAVHAPEGVIVTPAERLAAWDAAETPAARRAYVAALLPVIAVRKGGELLLFGGDQSLPELPRRGRRDGAPKLCPIEPGPATAVVKLPR